MLSRLGFWMMAALAAAGSVAPASTPRAVERPDSSTLIRLQAAADSAWRVRVTTDRGTYLLIAPRIDATGVTVDRADDPPALLTLDGYRAPEKRVTWEQIVRIDAERSAAGRGTVTGALAGAATGGIMVLATRPNLDWESEEGAWRAILGIGVMTVSGGLIGLLFGLGSGIPHQIYP